MIKLEYVANQCLGLHFSNSVYAASRKFNVDKCFSTPEMMRRIGKVYRILNFCGLFCCSMLMAAYRILYKKAYSKFDLNYCSDFKDFETAWIATRS